MTHLYRRLLCLWQGHDWARYYRMGPGPVKWQQRLECVKCGKHTRGGW